VRASRRRHGRIARSPLHTGVTPGHDARVTIDADLATDTSLAAASQRALAADGPLAEHLEGFRERPAQQRLSAAVAAAFEQRGALLAEAGTGTGKTYAYLVPALLSGRRTIVSTGTRALQDQLYHRDLPRLARALGVGVKAALLKGRGNYWCHHRAERSAGENRFASRAEAALFTRLLAWAGHSGSGDLAEFGDLPDDSTLWPRVTSTTENCLGSECPAWNDCFVVKARQRAQAADLVVVNHHLLLADLALKQEGFGEILPGAEAFVVDEAHQLPELAGQFFGENVVAHALLDLARDALAEAAEVPGALAAVQAPAAALELAIKQLRAALHDLPPRGTALQLCAHVDAAEALAALDTALAALDAGLVPLAEAAPGLHAAQLRAAETRARLLRWRDPLAAANATAAADAQAEADPDGWPGDDDDLHADLDAEAAGDDAVRWYETTARGFRLQRTPLDVAAPLAEYRARSRASWVFTSATLAVGGRFEHIAARLGLEAPTTLLEPSPFAWHTQALCYLPRGLPEPNQRDYTERLLDALLPVLHASRGRAFLLFAAHRSLRLAAERLRDGPWPLFVQGEAPRNLLLERFRASGNGVLLGAASFREGVDVVGDALSVVVLDKLPFAAPDDPVFQARLDAVRRHGGNPFRDEQLPQAVIALKQGVGRLIRSETDRGVLVLADPRITAKSYGRVFLDSLPPLPRSRDLADVEAFFATP
jgi:ATP-dependent DNA helicase DinG